MVLSNWNLMDSNDWEVVVNAIPATGGVSLVWSDPNSTNRTTAFYVVSDATIDADHDGFSDARERLITHTPTNQFNFVDSDNDGLHDWYEISFFGDLSESGTNDFDGDGLLNTQEWVLTSTSVEIICDPMNVDTDGDGTDDGVEYNQGSDPSDPGDEGNPPPPVTNTTTKVTMSIQGFYGEDSSVTLWLKSGTNSYSVSSIGHNVSSNTFDVVQGLRYTASLSFNGYTAGYRASIRGNGIIITDENSMLEDHELECCVDTNLTAAVDVIKVESIELVGAPSDGLVVKNGANVTMKANIFPTSYVPPENELKWYYQRLKTDGSWEAWISFGDFAKGKTYIHKTTISGVFRVKSILTVDGSVLCEKIYERTTDEADGYGKTGDPDAFGVTDTQIQISIRNAAKGFLGSTAYPYSGVVSAQYGFPEYPVNTYKCNIFVAHRAMQAGAKVPAINGIPAKYPPLANEWAGTEDTHPFIFGFQTDIDSWTLQRTSYPQPGFIVGHPNSSGPGHVGIVDYDGYGIGAGSGSGTVNKKYTLFLDGTSGNRKYE